MYCTRHKVATRLLIAAFFVCYGMLPEIQQVRAQTTVAPVLTEQETVEIARSANRRTKQSELDIDRAAMAIREARSNYLPQTTVTLAGGYPLGDIWFSVPAGTFGNYPATGPIPATRTTIEGGQQFSLFTSALIAQPISQLYKLHLSTEISRNALALAQESARQERQDVTQQVRRTYHEICLLEARLETDRSLRRALEQTLATEQNDVAQGTKLVAETLQVKSSLAQQRYEQANHEDALANTKEQLNLLLGRDVDTPFSVEPLSVISDEATDLSEARRIALQERPEIRLAKLQTAEADLEVRRQKADYIPDVSAQVVYVGFQGVDFLPKNVAVAGFGLNWNRPWDWGDRRAKIAALRDATKQQSLAAEEAAQQVTLDVDRKYGALAEARLFVEASRAGREASSEQLRNITDQFNQHAALISDVLSQSADDQKQSENYTRALQSYWNAQADFDRALGRD